MDKRILNNGGRALTELLLVMVILLAFGTSAFLMVFAGQQASQQLIDRQESQSELRTACAYIDTRLRQHDERGMISIRMHPALKTTALVIEEEYYGIPLETWIYFNKGYLREVLISPGEAIDDDISFTIASVDDFDVSGVNQSQTIVYKVTHGKNEEAVSRQGYYQIKTDQTMDSATD